VKVLLHVFGADMLAGVIAFAVGMWVVACPAWVGRHYRWIRRDPSPPPRTAGIRIAGLLWMVLTYGAVVASGRHAHATALETMSRFAEAVRAGDVSGYPLSPEAEMHLRSLHPQVTDSDFAVACPDKAPMAARIFDCRATFTSGVTIRADVDADAATIRGMGL
jgi:hypothetical protein